MDEPKKDNFKVPTFIVKEEGTLIIVRISGDINQHTLPESRAMIDKMVEEHRINERDHLSIIVDYENVSDVDSAAIANILDRLDENKKQHHRVAFINVPDEFVQLLEIYKLEDTIMVFDNEAEVIAKLNQT